MSIKARLDRIEDRLQLKFDHPLSWVEMSQLLKANPELDDFHWKLIPHVGFVRTDEIIRDMMNPEKQTGPYYKFGFDED